MMNEEKAIVMFRKLAELAESGDTEYQDGESPNSWLSWEPKVTDVQLGIFETMLSLGVEWFQEAKDDPDHCGHDQCAVRAMTESPFSGMVPPTTVLAIIHELQLHRTLYAMEASETLPDGWRASTDDSRSFLPIERHGEDDDNRDSH